MQVISTGDVGSNGYNYYSVSRLQTYLKCGEGYRLQYVEKVKREYTSSYSTVVGSLVHGALEEYLVNGSEGTLLEVLERVSYSTLVRLKVLVEGDEGIYDSLLRYAKGMASLYERASAGYTGSDAIRTTKGEVPSSPQSTTSWKDALVILGQGRLKDGLDAFFIGRGVAFSLCDAYAEAYSLVISYKVPTLEVMYVELPLSKYDSSTMKVINPIILPEGYGGEKGIYLCGSIDLVAMYNGALTVIDHKTSAGAAPSTEEVSTNPQLITYAWAYEQLTGHVVEGVAINHIRSGQMVWAPITPHRDKVLYSLLGVHKAVERDYFPMHTPSEYDSPCNKWYGKECPFKAHCWNS
jgi:PD-(D/E)XK nuclease superfamily